MSARSAQTSSRVMQNETQRSKNSLESGGGTLRRRLFPRCGVHAERRADRTASAGVGQKRRAARRNDRRVPLREERQSACADCQHNEDHDWPSRLRSGRIGKKRDRAGRSRRTGRLQYVSEKGRDADTRGPALRHDAPFRQ